MKLTAPKQRQGDHYENLARLYLEAQGLTCFAKNWHYKNIGELDLVMLDTAQTPPCLVIVEVRQRRSSQYGGGVASVTVAKQRKMIAATQGLLQAYPQFEQYSVRFDIVSFDADNALTASGVPIPTWLPNGFVVN